MEKAGDARHVLHFIAHDNQFCVELEWVERVLSLVALKPVPLSPRYVVGLMTLRGESIVVIDLAERLGLMDHDLYTVNTPILLCSNRAGKLTGLVISEIVGVDLVADDELQLVPLFEEPASPFESVVNTDRGPSLLLNVDRITAIDIMADGTDINFDPDKVSQSLAGLQT